MNDYTDYYLNFASEAEATAVLYTGDTANYQNISTIGIIYQPQTDPKVPPVPYDGWHVNVRLVGEEDATALTPFSIDPQPFPMRVWA